MTITAKFPSVCKACHGAIAIGDRVVWSPGVSGVAHLVCPEVPRTTTHAGETAAVPRSSATPATPVDVPIVNGAPIVALLELARGNGLKFPKVRFAASQSRELLLSLAPMTGRNPGAIYIKVQGEYRGMIAADGAMRGDITRDAELITLLTAIGADPARLAREYAAMTSCCSFCGLALSDAGSVEVGYGPICASRYGLPHTPKGTPAIVVVSGAGVLETEV